MANTREAWRGAVEPAGAAPAGNEQQLWRGAVEPPGALVGLQRVAPLTIDNSTAGVTSHSFSHTTTGDTDLLLLYVHIEGNESVSGLPTFDGADFTVIQEQASTGNNGDTRSHVYGLISPGKKTATIAVSFASSSDPSCCICVNYHGVDTASVAAATNQAGSVQNTTTSATVAFSSAGTSGNGLVASVVGQGADMSPMSFDNSFLELWDHETGGGSAITDFGHGGAELLSGIPSALTVTMGATDECGGLMVELVVPAGATTHEVALTLAGSGNLTAANILTAEVAATLAGSFQITGIAAAAFEVAATLAASNNLTTAAAVSLEVAATLAASSNLTILSQADYEAAAVLAASGNVTAIGALVTDQALTLAASMNLTAAAALITDVAATLAASSNLTTAQDITLEASAALGASLNLATAASLIAEVDATLAASTQLTTAAELLAEVAATLAASVQLVSLGELEAIEVTAALGASFNLTTAFDYIGEALATLGFSSDLTAANIATLLTDAGIAFRGEITPVTALETRASAALLWSVDIVSAGTTFVGSLVTPDGRKIVILADTRSVTVLEDTRNITIH